jgi:polyisoprenyl-phosphate glycosyltransferase
MMLSIVTPAYNEELNLPILYQHLRQVMDTLGEDWEWIITDDHSGDETFCVISELARQDPHVKGFRLSRNFGAHRAMWCGLNHVRGDCAVLMASDLQNPPELIPDFLAEWKKGAQVVMATRSDRGKESLTSAIPARLYYLITSQMEGFKNRPPGGMDFCLLDHIVIEALKQFQESHVGIMSLIAWMGFRRAYVWHKRPPRLQGTSKWSFARKLNMAFDSITAFSYAPIKAMTYFGFASAVAGFLFALYTIFRWLSGAHPPEGWPSLMIVVLFMGGIQMIMMGILGEYIWRGLDEARHRPRYIIENQTGKND